MQEHRPFADRREAGEILGKMLEPAYKDHNVVVLGIPRGGVSVAYEVARILRAPLSVLITKKLPHPLHEELAIGACAEDGSVFLTTLASNISPDIIREILLAQRREIDSRIQRFRGGRPIAHMTDRIVILVDDGIATGSTIVPAIKLCRSNGAARVVVAVPVSGHSYVSEIDDLADEVVVAQHPPNFFAVGQAYRDFHHLSDGEVVGFLRRYQQAHELRSGKDAERQ